ncbi:PRC-barrel domain-containing protein [Streptomyces albidoflavus]|uniref:PRC-barrel domain-containing protein n=1 Tax=Streptomyces TaxID=1883 RepID=UPI0002493BB3|nr:MULTISPECIES: PRC-barrel domain-containing protein [Streptomyces]MBO1286394.1 PRC-barrel domain containing protein [Streptomyces sampsonii]NUW09188.1 PRC-barrel domain containing protein [Streptomyces sp. CAI-21]NVI32495.1 PRC-barrel domain containing protein [Streptomyces sp. CAI-17]QPA00458.1 PRC-barrel domain containing protein [Streptomyces violascens]MCU7704391.1 PRC-barrel domain-containing protein [Streptomyces albidoflavus]
MSDGIWGYQPTAGHTAGTDLIGYKVEATDGTIGKVDKHSDEVGSSYLVVDTGVWIFGKHVLLPAGTVRTVDGAERKIHVELTKEQIKNSPEFDKDRHVGDREYHDKLGGYYGGHRPL